MKGFFKRDITYMISSLKLVLLIYGISIAFTAVGAVIDQDYGFLMFFINLTAFLSAATGAIGLPQYDAQSGWMAYAAAVPDGRRDQVTARYLLAAVCCLTAAVLAGSVSLGLGGVDSFLGSLAALGGVLLVQALFIPLSYRFGLKGLLIGFLVLSMGCFPIGFGVGYLGAMMEHEFDSVSDFLTAMGLPLGTLALGLVLAGLAAMGISYAISCRIMARKEL